MTEGKMTELVAKLRTSFVADGLDEKLAERTATLLKEQAKKKAKETAVLLKEQAEKTAVLLKKIGRASCRERVLRLV